MKKTFAFLTIALMVSAFVGFGPPGEGDWDQDQVQVQVLIDEVEAPMPCYDFCATESLPPTLQGVVFAADQDIGATSCPWSDERIARNDNGNYKRALLSQHTGKPHQHHPPWV